MLLLFCLTEYKKIVSDNILLSSQIKVSLMVNLR